MLSEARAYSVIEDGFVTRFEPKRYVSTERERSSSTLRTAGDGEASHLSKYLQPQPNELGHSDYLGPTATSETLPARFQESKMC